MHALQLDCFVESVYWLQNPAIVVWLSGAVAQSVQPSNVSSGWMSASW